MPTLTPLSTILNRMDRRQSIATVEEQYKVRDLDSAIRKVRMKTQLPWTLQKSTLRVFKDVLEYPVDDNHDELAIVDNDKVTFGGRARFRFTSIKEFYEDINYRNDLAEIWDAGDRYLGIRYNTEGFESVQLDGAESDDDYSYSEDVTALAEDSVVFKEGNGSIRVTIVNSAGSATVENTFISLGDSNYKRKYYFRWVYLAAAPTSITLRLGNDDSNYLGTTVTAQFSGQAFKAGAWNLLAFDLSTGTETGTFDSAVIDYQSIVFTGAASGTYYLDTSYMRAWKLLDYWFYSKLLIATVDATVANQEYFFNSSEIYSTDSQLVGDSDYADWIRYEAELITLSDEENEEVLKTVKNSRNEARANFLAQFPSEKQLITTQKRRFTTEFNKLSDIAQW